MNERPALSIQWRLGGAFALALGISILVVVLSYRTTARFIASSRAAASASRTTIELERVISVMQDAETGQRGFLLTGDDSYLAPYREALQRLGQERQALAEAAGQADSATVARIGRLMQVELYIIVPPGMPARTIEEWDQLRDDIGARIGSEGPNRWLTIAFTADTEWAE